MMKDPTEKPVQVTMVSVYTGEIYQLMLASDGFVWSLNSLRKDGFPNRTHAPGGRVITRHTSLGVEVGVEGRFAVYDAQREVRTSILRERIDGLRAQLDETIAELEALYLEDNNAEAAPVGEGKTVAI